MVLDDLVAGLRQGRELPGFGQAASQSGQVPMVPVAQLGSKVYDRAGVEASPASVEDICADLGYAVAILYPADV